MYNPNSLKNLKPFKKGENGNHGKGYSLTSALKAALEKPLVEPKADAPARDHVVYQTIKGAIEGQASQVREVWDRSDGKVPNESEVTGDITINLVSKIPRPQRINADSD